jgi:hypothetical protein
VTCETFDFHSYFPSLFFSRHKFFRSEIDIHVFRSPLEMHLFMGNCPAVFYQSLFHIFMINIFYWQIIISPYAACRHNLRFCKTPQAETDASRFTGKRFAKSFYFKIRNVQVMTINKGQTNV